MDATLQPGRLEDADTCGMICYEAFKEIAGVCLPSVLYLREACLSAVLELADLL